MNIQRAFGLFVSPNVLITTFMAHTVYFVELSSWCDLLRAVPFFDPGVNVCSYLLCKTTFFRLGMMPLPALALSKTLPIISATFVTITPKLSGNSAFVFSYGFSYLLLCVAILFHYRNRVPLFYG